MEANMLDLIRSTAPKGAAPPGADTGSRSDIPPFAVLLDAGTPPKGDLSPTGSENPDAEAAGPVLGATALEPGISASLSTAKASPKDDLVGAAILEAGARPVADPLAALESADGFLPAEGDAPVFHPAVETRPIATSGPLGIPATVEDARLPGEPVAASGEATIRTPIAAIESRGIPADGDARTVGRAIRAVPPAPVAGTPPMAETRSPGQAAPGQAAPGQAAPGQAAPGQVQAGPAIAAGARDAATRTADAGGPAPTADVANPDFPARALVGEVHRASPPAADISTDDAVTDRMPPPRPILARTTPRPEGEASTVKAAAVDEAPRTPAASRDLPSAMDGESARTVAPAGTPTLAQGGHPIFHQDGQQIVSLLPNGGQAPAMEWAVAGSDKLGAAGRQAMPLPERTATQAAIGIQRALADGRERISLKLYPAQLGRIDVRIEIAEDGALRAVIAAEKAETLDLMQRDARSLERALQNAGLKTDSGSLSFDQGAGGRDAQADAGASQGEGHGTPAGPEPGSDAAASAPPPSTHHGLLDMSV